MMSRLEVNRREFVGSIGLSSLALLTGVATAPPHAPGVVIGGLGPRGRQYFDLLIDGKCLHVDRIAERGSIVPVNARGALRSCSVEALARRHHSSYAIAAASPSADRELVAASQLRGIPVLWDVPAPGSLDQLAEGRGLLTGFQGLFGTRDLRAAVKGAERVSIRVTRGMERSEDAAVWTEAFRESLAAFGATLGALGLEASLSSLSWSRTSAPGGLTLRTLVPARGRYPEASVHIEIGARFPRSRRPEILIECASTSRLERHHASAQALVALDIVALTRPVDPQDSARMVRIWQEASGSVSARLSR